MHTAHSATSVEAATCPLPQFKQAFTTETSLGWYLPLSQFEQPVAVTVAAYFPFPHFLHVSSSVGPYAVGFSSLYLPVGQSLQLLESADTAYFPGSHFLQVAVPPPLPGTKYSPFVHLLSTPLHTESAIGSYAIGTSSL